jgi:hypothetical protein
MNLELVPLAQIESAGVAKVLQSKKRSRNIGRNGHLDPQKMQKSKQRRTKWKYWKQWKMRL